MDAADSPAEWLRLTLIPGIGGETQRKLLHIFGHPEEVFRTGRSALADVVGDKATKLLLDTDNRAAIERAVVWSQGADQHLLCLADPSYPQALLQIPDPPTLLYVRGRLELLNEPALAIVGSRNPTPQGVQNAERFATALAEAGLSVVSGLALGIDAAAHRGALSVAGNTVAFIGTGIDRIYPAANRQLALDIAARGAMVSEFSLGTPPAAANFPRRNRLLSGFSRGALVVEATVDSGSLITARLAAEQGREVFAVPGSIHSPQSRGCHKLIKQGAKLVETVQDILDEIGWASVPPKAAAASDSSSKAGDLLPSVGFDPCSLDDIARRSNLTADAVSVMLLHLELDGQVASLPGGRYQRIIKA
ncbi:Protein smf [Candidatus Accumulibacter aalborgensis]|uniref:Protein smf n=1 Tax=Candidatus Accumulibacter aalborgensis TaxID=1860102 RepID=A0A1A8XSW7_9PROT|nr:DNA-processing protein DprA [Candidatus Accumulibacter aalborgensis]SBT08179.1 Protein smf [Candidatus Accumulibacter aalborgensis]